MISTADGWRDYTLLDAGDGERLELWGPVKVIRPDPQAFWPRSYKWEKPDMHYHRSKSGGGTWETLKNVPQQWQIPYDNLNLRFHVRPTGFKHMGLFPEQAVNWQWLHEVIKTAGALPPHPHKGTSPLDPITETARSAVSNESFFEGGLGETFFSEPQRCAAREARFCEAKLLTTKKVSPEKPLRILNLFAYTGGATLACLRSGADVTHIDAAKGMNNQARDNIALSGLGNAKFRVLTDDVLKFVKREARRGNMYEGVIMDPPVFGRGPGGEMWRLEEGLYGLVEACVGLLSPNARFILINAYTAGFSPVAYGNILSRAVVKAGRVGEVTAGEVGLRAKSGVLLPCGMYARWKAEQPSG